MSHQRMNRTVGLPRGVARRDFLSGSLAAGFLGGFSSLMNRRTAHAVSTQNPNGRFRRCIVLWMEGGPSQLDTFDPKPGGPRESISTSVPGLRFADTLPGLAQRAEQLCVLRSVGSAEGEHERATHLLHTGFAQQPSFPRPALGSMVADESTDRGFPRYVTLGNRSFGPAFLGPASGPFLMDDLADANRRLRMVASRRNGLTLLDHLNQSYDSNATSRSSRERSGQIESLRRLLDTPFPEAVDLQRASESDRERYGDHLFGQRLCIASRLSQMGVPFVEAQLNGWDTHVDNQRRTKQLCGQLEQPWLALVDDLQANGLWDDTLIVWMGEFGRTPRLNAGAGRDHFPEATPVVLAGGDLGGRVIGQTSPDGGERSGEKHSIADLMATILTLMGIDLKEDYTTEFGSPTTKVDGGTPISSIVT